MQTYAFPRFTQSQVDVMPKGPSTLEGVLAEWSAEKIATHALISDDPAGYIVQSITLSTMSLYAVGATVEQVMDHAKAVAAACVTKFQQAGPRGHA